jgi:Spy/CpxP family protein refolding chaperone
MHRVLGSAIAAAIVLASVTPVLAAKSNTGGESASIQKIVAMKKKLNLTEEQSAQLRTIRDELRAKNEPLKQQLDQTLGPRPKPEDLRAMPKGEKKKLVEQRRAAYKQHPELKPIGEQIQANRRAAKEQALAVLTPEQRQILEKEKKSMKGKRGQAAAPEVYDAAGDADED